MFEIPSSEKIHGGDPGRNRIAFDGDHPVETFRKMGRIDAQTAGQIDAERTSVPFFRRRPPRCWPARTPAAAKYSGPGNRTGVWSGHAVNISTGWPATLRRRPAAARESFRPLVQIFQNRLPGLFPQQPINFFVRHVRSFVPNSTGDSPEIFFARILPPFQPDGQRRQYDISGRRAVPRRSARPKPKRRACRRPTLRSRSAPATKHPLPR